MNFKMNLLSWTVTLVRYIFQTLQTTLCPQVDAVLQMWLKGHKKIWLDLPLMIDSAFCAGAAMITFGAILGKVSPTQLTYLLVLEVYPSLLYAAHKQKGCHT